MAIVADALTPIAHSMTMNLPSNEASRLSIIALPPAACGRCGVSADDWYHHHRLIKGFLCGAASAITATKAA
jgi:hypothetical protein